MFGFFNKKTLKIKELESSNKNLMEALDIRQGYANALKDENETLYNLVKTNKDNTTEIEHLTNALRILKDFCIDNGYDLTPLLGTYSKSIKNMTREELVARNNQVNEKQRTKVSAPTFDAAPMPTFEESELLAKSQVSRSVVGFNKYIVNTLTEYKLKSIK